MKRNIFTERYIFSRIKKILINTYGKHTLYLVKKAKVINKELFKKMKGITRHTPMVARIEIALPIIAIWLASDRNIKPDSMGEIMYKTVDSFWVQWICSRFNMNNSNHMNKYMKKMEKIANWPKKHSKESKAWRFSFNNSLHKEGCYYAVTFCPIADFCKRNGFQDIAPILCKIDYLIVQLQHGNLLREKTIASGDDFCDFWIVGDQTLMFHKW